MLRRATPRWPARRSALARWHLKSTFPLRLKCYVSNPAQPLRPGVPWSARKKKSPKGTARTRVSTGPLNAPRGHGVERQRGSSQQARPSRLDPEASPHAAPGVALPPQESPPAGALTKLKFTSGDWSGTRVRLSAHTSFPKKGKTLFPGSKKKWLDERDQPEARTVAPTTGSTGGLMRFWLTPVSTM